ncbi:MAG: hydrogenase 4 subunit B [Candidatus Methanoperedenaceae archaeon]|nr:MAG: hydrogenase 4 subunit B [Candidatus Methanoperedenaceae archaeon]
MLDNYLFIGLIVFYLLGALSALIFNKKDTLCSYISLLSASAGALSGLIFSLSVIFGDTFQFILNEGQLPEFGFFINKLSAFFIFVISISVFAVSIFSTGYVKEYFGKKNIGYLCFLYNIFILSMILVISANNAIMFLIVWELMSVISFFLVVYEHEKIETRKAGFIYIVMTHIGTGFIILSFLIFAGASGSFSFETFRAAGSTMTPFLKDIVFLFAFIGFGTKAGIVPFHIWLPYAHPAAPGNISALMSGVMIKTAIFMLIRISFDFLGASQSWWGYIVLTIGTISAILGILYAVVEPDIKRMLAFSSIENIGIILIGLGASMIFLAGEKPILSAIAMIAALYHLLNHSVFKGLLFMGAGSILYSTHTKNIEKLGGLIRRMPLSSILILIGVLSISAMPPFSGFVSEWLTFQSLLLTFNLDSNFTIIMLSVSAAFLALTGALAAYCFLKFFGMVFLALPRSENAQHAKEVNIPMLAGMGFFALLSIMLGILPAFVLPVLDRIASSFIGTGGQSFSFGALGTISIPSSFGVAISTPGLLAILLILMFIPAIILFINKRNMPIYETWGCGQPFSTARNEYSATAFSKPVQMWFKGLYRPAREMEVTYSSRYLKESFKFKSGIVQLFEENLYIPVADFVMAMSRKAKVIQTGSIHAYLGYIFGILVILFMFVIAGGS